MKQKSSEAHCVQEQVCWADHTNWLDGEHSWWGTGGKVGFGIGKTAEAETRLEPKPKMDGTPPPHDSSLTPSTKSVSTASSYPVHIPLSSPLPTQPHYMLRGCLEDSPISTPGLCALPALIRPGSHDSPVFTTTLLTFYILALELSTTSMSKFLVGSHIHQFWLI
jgi:hypothetical protein